MTRPYLKYFIKTKETSKGKICSNKSNILTYNLDTNFSITKTGIINPNSKKIITLTGRKVFKAFFTRFGWMEIPFKSIGMMISKICEQKT